MAATLHSTDLDRDRCPRCGVLLGEFPTPLLSLRAKVEKLQAALEPFTKLGGPNDGVMPAFHDLEDNVVIYKNSGECVTAGDVRAARNAFGVLHTPWAIPSRDIKSE